MKKIFNKILEKIKMIFEKIKEFKKKRELNKDLKDIFATQMEIAAHWTQVKDSLLQCENIDSKTIDECDRKIYLATGIAVNIYIKLHNLERNFEES